MDQAQGMRERVAAVAPAGPPLRVIAVTSGKGGVGKTHVSANLAVLAARAGRRVLLVDGDLGLANADLVLGVEPSAHVGHLLDGSASAEDVLSQGPHGIAILGASSGIHQLAELKDEQKAGLLSALDTLDHRFDLVLVDCGAGIGSNVVFFAGAAQEALLVVSPEPTSLSDAYATVKVLSEVAGVPRFGVIANQAADFQGRDVFRRLTQVTSRFLGAHLSYLGAIPRDESLPRALHARRPLVDLYPRSSASRALDAIYEKIVASAPPSTLDGGVRLFWRQLLRERTGS
jgi:flagellar biosynthesis protein FlhG